MGNIVSFRPRLTPSASEIPAALTDAELREQIEVGMQAALDVADHFIAVLNRMDGCAPLQDNEPAEAPQVEAARATAAVVQLRERFQQASAPVETVEAPKPSAETVAMPEDASSVIHVEPMRWGGNGNIIARAGVAVFDLSAAASGVLSSLTWGR